uniref:DNA primase n=1 Tax=viral metagenome TaxID=1070528 RepID=A0A6M3J468_9ZZZZ
MSTVGDPVAFVESRFGLQLRKVGPTEWAGPCPFCGGRDRWHLWLQGNYWCRPGTGHCGRSGWLDELDGARQLTKEEMLELRLAAIERKQEEQDRRLSVLEQMHACEDHLLYHRNLETNAVAVDYWLNEGMNPQTIHDYKLGYCLSCPTARCHASYTIPVMAGGKLFNIRHRIAHPTDGGKYRPHLPGLPAMLFNYDDLARKDDPRVIISEGEKKAMVIHQQTNIPVVATMGMQSFKPEWARKFPPRFRTVYVAYDPDALERAAAVAQLFEERGRVVDLPMKADDMFVRYGGTEKNFLGYLLSARSV